jgi:HrpA-like RNA helicase
MSSDGEHLFFSGRAGRVSKGYCYRLVHKDFWDNSIPDHVVPEMLVMHFGYGES